MSNIDIRASTGTQRKNQGISFSLASSYVSTRSFAQKYHRTSLLLAWTQRYRVKQVRSNEFKWPLLLLYLPSFLNP